MAQQTVAPFAVIALLGEEAPVDGDSARVRDDRLDHRPHHHEEQQVKDHGRHHHEAGPQPQHELEHERVVVEHDEHQHPHEVRVYQLPQRNVPQRHYLLFEFNYSVLD